jgi:hypothetical protein
LSEPLTREGVLETIEKAMASKDFKAKILVTRGCKVKGETDYSSEEFSVGVILERPTDATLISDVHKVKADLELLIGEFKGEHLLKTPSSSTVVQKSSNPQAQKTEPTLPHGINQIEWWPNKFPEDVPAEKRGEYARADQTEAAELRKTLENVGKPIEIQGLSYLLNAARTYIYRRPVEATK